MTTKRPGQITHLPPIRRRDSSTTLAQKASLRKRLAERGVRVRADIAAWMTLDELSAIWRATINASDRYVAERYDYDKGEEHDAR